MAFVLVQVLFVGAVHGQVVLEGDVRDAETGEALIAATVQVDGTNRGTITTSRGHFVIQVDALPARLHVRHIGYESRTVEIVDRSDAGTIVIQLEPSTVPLDELVVEGGNPAHAIMRKALERKQDMYRHVSSMYIDTYTRFMLYREFSLVQIRESVRATWWSRDSGPKDVVRATRVRPQGGGTFRFAGPHPTVNLHDDHVPVMGTVHVGPLHPDALDLYRFTLGELRQQDGRRIYDVYFVPRSETSSAFSGRLSIADSTWHVLEISARPTPSTVVTPPVLEHTYFLDEKFVQLGDTLTVPLSLFINGVVRFGQPGASYPAARYEQSTGMSLHVINSGVPDSLAVSARREFVHPRAAEQDFLFSHNPSLIPMTPRQAEELRALPADMTINRAFRPSGILRAYTSVDVTEEPEEPDGPLSGELARLDQFTSGDWFWYNRVDGWHPGFGWGRGGLNGRRFRVDIGYSVERERMSYHVQGSVPWSFGSDTGPLRGVIGTEVQDATAIIARTDDLGRFLPGLLTYLGNDDFYDYYHRRAGKIYAQIGRGRDPARLRVAFNAETHNSVFKNTDFDGWLFKNEQRPNPPINSGDLRTIETTIAVGRSEVSTASLSVERTLDGWVESDYDYTRLEARGTIRMSTFLAERARPNRMRVTALAGTRFGDLPIQRRFTIDGSAGPLSDYSGFRTLADSRIISNRLVGLFWWHDFTTLPFEILGLWPLADLGMGIHIFGGHARLYDEAYTNREQGRYNELGAGLTYPLGLPVRLDVGVNLESGAVAFRFGAPLK